MAAYKTPTFEDRAASARAAKDQALEKLRNKAAPDPEQVAARAAARAARDAVEAEKRAARQQALADAKAAKEQARAEAKAAAEAAAEAAAALRRPAPPPKMPTAEEMKAARDARYAARKARQRG
ncbi:DUF6481 family protein [Sphingomonas sp.]|uniref:DUF6481 family protein n=1 Tax=Sphingomonas sp. TaxID=28214 RepID=UPI003B00DE97